MEFEHSISAAIIRLRQALDDSPDNPCYIETLARRGYRLLPAVEWMGGRAADISADLKRDADSARSAAIAPGLDSAQQATEGAIIAPRPGARSRWPVVALCASMTVLVIAAGWTLLNRYRNQHLPTPRVVPFTGLSGLESLSAFYTRRQSVSVRFERRPRGCVAHLREADRCGDAVAAHQQHEI